jgi:cytochrome c biogenesis protein CcmG, thiol:disulfide interchange protein DsbE
MVARGEAFSSRSRRWARLALALVPALLFLGVLTSVTIERSTIPEPGDPAPEFSAPLLEGDGTLALSELRGRPLVLNFWASWCVPCKDEAPLLKGAHEQFGKRVEFVGVDIKDARSSALAFARRYDLDYLHVRDENGAIYADYGLTGQPETFFIDGEGEIVEHVNGPVPEDVMYQLLNVLVSRDG